VVEGTTTSIMHRSNPQTHQGRTPYDSSIHIFIQECHRTVTAHVESYLGEPMCGSQTSLPTYDLPFSIPATHQTATDTEVWAKDACPYREPYQARVSVCPPSGPNDESLQLSLPSRTPYFMTTLPPSAMTLSNKEHPIKLLALGKTFNYYSFAN